MKWKYLAACASAFLIASTAFGTDVLTVRPTSLLFGDVSQGQAKKLNLTLKAALGVSVKVVSPAPFLAGPERFTLQRLSYGEVTVTLPPTAPIGEHKGKLILKVTPLTIAGNNTEIIEIPLHATVVAGVPRDFFATGEVERCSLKRDNRSCVVNLHLTTTGSAPASVRTQVYEARDGNPEKMTLDRLMEYRPETGATTSYEIPTLPARVKELRLRIVIDPENEVHEQSEENNETTLTLNIPE